MNHDYCHCSNKGCSKKESCERYDLYLEDLAGRSTGWCSYAGFKPDDKGQCENYVKKEV